MESTRPPAWTWRHKLGAARKRNASSPQAAKAAAFVQEVAGGLLASRDDVAVAGDAPGMITVRYGGAEIALTVMPTGVLEKTCEYAGCGKPFWYSEGGVADARFCSQACARRRRRPPSTPEQKAARRDRMRRARRRAGAAGVAPHGVSRTLRFGLGLKTGEPSGFTVRARGQDVAVYVSDKGDLPCFAKLLAEAGYQAGDQAGILVVTGRSGGDGA